MRRAFKGVLLGLAGAALLASPVFAQSYPNKPIKVIVPLPAGSVTDVAVRAIGTEIAAKLGGQPWVVDNRPGGAMVIGAELCAKAPADGYTLCVIGPDAMSFNPYMLASLPYDPDKDFTPITDLFNVIEGVIRSSSLSANSMAEFKAAAAAKSLNFATLGPGSTPDVFRHWLSDQWKVNLVEVSYKGGADVANALFKAEVEVGRIGIGNVVSQLSEGKIKVLAVSSPERSPLLPSVPTLAESGLGAYPVNVWWGLAGPAKLPDAAVARINDALKAVFAEPKMKEFLDKQFLVSRLGTPQEFAAFLKADRANVADLLKKYNVPRQ
jgi:tripartite-type tricarboxylate transporter receptor subunit TctC